MARSAPGFRTVLEDGSEGTLGADLTAAARVAAGSDRDFVAAGLIAAVLAFAGVETARAGALETGFDVRLAEPALTFCLLMDGLVWLNK